jgi:hypothetical protein
MRNVNIENAKFHFADLSFVDFHGAKANEKTSFYPTMYKKNSINEPINSDKPAN